MNKPRSLLYLPAGTLAAMKPFRRWVHQQHTCQVVSDEGNGPGFDLVEFYAFMCPRYLQETIPTLVREHIPFQLLLNLAVPSGGEERILFIRRTHAGVAEQAADWADLEPPSLEFWRNEFLSHPTRFSQFRDLARRYLSPAEYGARANEAQ